MTARVSFTLRGARATATLTAGRWACDDLDVRLTLQSLADADGPERSPGDGIPWRRHAVRVAAALGGTVEFPPLPPVPPGRVY